MNMDFKTGRLEVVFLVDVNNLSNREIFDLLTDEVTRYLPPDWQGITDNKKAGEWLEKRLCECSVFTIFANQSENLIGFLFVYGIKEKNKEIRIGYIISEKYWGHGYASEVVGGLVGLMAQTGNVSSIIAGVAKGHVGSIKVLTKNGFMYTELNNNTEFYRYQF